MATVTASEAKQNFGELLDKAQRENITIVKHGRPVAVMISAHKFEEEQKHKQFEMAERASDLDDFIDDPARAEMIARKIKKSREQFERGEVYSAKEVYADMREKIELWSVDEK